MARVIFFGSPAGAGRVLREVVSAGHEVAAVYTQPPRAAGRSKEPVSTPVEAAARQLGLVVRTPVGLRDAEAQRDLSGFGADVFLVAGYGRLLPAAVLDMPPLGVLNVHPSLLPRHRGPSPVATAILEGDRETGVTVMLLDEGMDTGPVLAQSAPVEIGPSTTGSSLTERLFEIGASLLVSTLARWVSGEIEPRPQDESRATVSRLLKRADGEINWSEPAERIERMVRAYDAWPGAYTRWSGKNLKVLEAALAGEVAGRPGEVSVADGEIAVATGSGALSIVRLQLEGRRPASAAEFARGYPALDGSSLPS